jgi:alpha-tubulin suppressor-like RCC1 family protein
LDAWYQTKWRTSKSYKLKSGFGFAAITSSGAAVYWGKVTKDDYPEYGDSGTLATVAVPSGVEAIIPTRTAFVAILSNGRYVAWGAKEIVRGYNASNTGRTLDRSLPVPFVANDAAFAGIKNGGSVIAFGAPGHGENVHDEAHTKNITTALSANVVSITANAAAFVAVLKKGYVFTWGPSLLGGGVSSYTKPALANVQRPVFATRTAFAALKADGTVVAWGDPYGGGDASAVQSRLTNVQHIVASQSVFIAFKHYGEIVVWGQTEYGGDASEVAERLTSGVAVISQTAVAFAALMIDYTVVTWGMASRGGDSSAVSAQLRNIRTIYSNHFAFAAVNYAGGVVAWGDAENGGSIPSHLVQELSSGVTEVFSTHRAFAALKGESGKLILWGNAYHGADAGSAAVYLGSGVRTVCSNDVAFTAILRDGRAVVWGHTTSIPFVGLLQGGFSFNGVAGCV